MKMESQALIMDFNPYEIRTQAEATHNIGELVISGDRKFRYAKAGEALSAAHIAVQDDIVAQTAMVVISGAIGTTIINFTNAATTTTAGDYDGGYAIISAGTGIGQTYKIKSMAALTSGGTSKVEIDHPLVTGLDTTSRLDLVKNLYMDVKHTATATLHPAGVPLVAVTADNDYCWLQTRGVCGVRADAAIAAGSGAEVDGSVAGEIDVIVEADYVVNPLIGRAFWHAGVQDEVHPIFLMID